MTSARYRKEYNTMYRVPSGRSQVYVGCRQCFHGAIPPRAGFCGRMPSMKEAYLSIIVILESSAAVFLCLPGFVPSVCK
ncbi:hypothetical protein FKP32DRAFT_1589493 [Trametes sanguinea]|nr:hypothetical protein FKP32DRAFT_1589493 [Trametes sanguinea]